MAQRFNMEISDDFFEVIDEVALKNEIALADMIRKAIQLYIAAHRGAAQGLKVGLIDKQTNQMVTEFVGL